jgi:signal transduction histidine kinase
MAASSAFRNPSFFWQGILISLPALVLAIIGVYSLRQDHLMVGAEARRRAEQMANDLAQAISDECSRLTTPAQDSHANSSAEHRDLLWSRVLEIDSRDNLVWPPSYPEIPEPALLDLTSLRADQRQLLSDARSAEFGQGDLATAKVGYARLFALNPAGPLLPHFQYSFGQLLWKQDDLPGAVQVFQSLPQSASNHLAESGLPLRHLVYWRLLEASELTESRRLGPIPFVIGEFASNIVCQPSILTPDLLGMLHKCAAKRGRAESEAQRWQNIWREHQFVRDLYREGEELLRELKRSREFQAGLGPATRQPDKQHAWWLDAPEETLLLAISSETDATNRFLCFRKQECSRLLLGTRFIERLKTVPPYFVSVVQMAGRPVFTNNVSIQAGENSSKAVLSQPSASNEKAIPLLATAEVGSPGATVGSVAIYLADAPALFAHHTRRAVWFSLVLASAVVAAVVGWLSARQAFRRQVRLNEMKSDFVSSVSHELRAPIASVRLMAEGLESGRLSSEAKRQQYFKFIVQECRRLTSLIENVLDFGRIEQGRKEYEFEPTNIVALVEQTTKLMEPYAAERSVTLRLVIDGSACSKADDQPLLDGRAVQQALINLLDNAIKHSPKDATVTTGLNIEPPSGHALAAAHLSPVHSRAAHLHLWVEDHGKGIAATEHGRIFERFYRLGSELRRETQGIGIGLSIVKHVAEAHGGRVVVRSAPGQGSRFTIELPMHRGKSEEAS